jgi:hypothetical protein
VSTSLAQDDLADGVRAEADALGDRAVLDALADELEHALPHALVVRRLGVLAADAAAARSAHGFFSGTVSV